MAAILADMDEKVTMRSSASVATAGGAAPSTAGAAAAAAEPRDAPMNAAVISFGGGGGGSASAAAVADLSAADPQLIGRDHMAQAIANLHHQLMEGDDKKRSNLPERTTEILRRWLIEHWENPYPNKNEKQRLSAEAMIGVAQVSNWFVNARARVWKPVVDRASRDIGSSTGGAAAGGGGAVFVSALGGGDEFHIGIGAATSAGAADSGLGTPKRARTRKRNRAGERNRNSKVELDNVAIAQKLQTMFHDEDSSGDEADLFAPSFAYAFGTVETAALPTTPAAAAVAAVYGHSGAAAVARGVRFKRTQRDGEATAGSGGGEADAAAAGGGGDDAELGAAVAGGDATMMAEGAATAAAAGGDATMTEVAAGGPAGGEDGEEAGGEVAAAGGGGDGTALVAVQPPMGISSAAATPFADVAKEIDDEKWVDRLQTQNVDMTRWRDRAQKLLNDADTAPEKFTKSIAAADTIFERHAAMCSVQLRANNALQKSTEDVPPLARGLVQNFTRMAQRLVNDYTQMHAVMDSLRRGSWLRRTSMLLADSLSVSPNPPSDAAVLALVMEAHGLSLRGAEYEALIELARSRALSLPKRQRTTGTRIVDAAAKGQRTSRAAAGRGLAGSWIDRMITKLLHAPLLEQIETAMAEWEATQGALATYAAERDRLAQYARMAKEVLQQLEVYKQCAQSLGRPRVSLAGFEKIRRRHHRLLIMIADVELTFRDVDNMVTAARQWHALSGIARVGPADPHSASAAGVRVMFDSVEALRQYCAAGRALQFINTYEVLGALDALENMIGPAEAWFKDVASALHTSASDARSWRLRALLASADLINVNTASARGDVIAALMA